MKMLKKLFLISGLLALMAMLFTPPAEAQTMVFTNHVAITNSIAPSVATTSNLGSPVDLQYHRDCFLMFKFTGNGSGTSLVGLTLARSHDGTTATLETTPRFVWFAAQNGTTQVIAVTNLDTSTIGAMRYLHVVAITNASASVTMTNASLDVITKSKP